MVASDDVEEIVVVVVIGGEKDMFSVHQPVVEDGPMKVIDNGALWP